MAASAEKGRSFSATVALIAYNQSKFVRESVLSVLAQEGEGLEILLSDDCSQDDTFEILEEIAAGYTGPHTITLNRNTNNLGLVGHVNKIFEISNSEIIVFCAGDDISYPHRTRKILQSFMGDRPPILVHSTADIMNSQGKHSDESYLKASFFETTDPIKVLDSKALYLGATGAFHKDIMRKYGPLKYDRAFEDLTLGFRAALEGRIFLISEPLIAYRADVGISQKPERATSTVEKTLQRKKEVLCWKEVLQQRLDDLSLSVHPEKEQITQKIEKNLINVEVRICFLDGFRSTLPFWRSHPLVALKGCLSEANRIYRKQ